MKTEDSQTQQLQDDVQEARLKAHHYKVNTENSLKVIAYLEQRVFNLEKERNQLMQSSELLKVGNEMAFCIKWLLLEDGTPSSRTTAESVVARWNELSNKSK